MINNFSVIYGYKIIMFHAYDDKNNIIDNANVIMSIGSNFAIVTLDSIPNTKERILLSNQLHKNNKDIISITLSQMKKMSGNVIEISLKNKEKKIFMTESAYNSFKYEQLKKLSSYGELYSINMKNIEITKNKIFILK